MPGRIADSGHRCRRGSVHMRRCATRFVRMAVDLGSSQNTKGQVNTWESWSSSLIAPGLARKRLLLELTRTHTPILRQQGLATDRPAYAMRADDGTIIEVFEWKSQAAIDAAHTNPEVLKMWGRYAEVCEYVPWSPSRNAAICSRVSTRSNCSRGLRPRAGYALPASERPATARPISFQSSTRS